MFLPQKGEGGFSILEKDRKVGRGESAKLYLMS